MRYLKKNRIKSDKKYERRPTHSGSLSISCFFLAFYELFTFSIMALSVTNK